jgi:Domain of unknown function (DUF4136)
MKKNHQVRPFGRRHFLVFLVTIFLGSLLSACSSGLQVRSDSDPGANFSQYNSYNFFDPMGVEGGYNSPIFGEHFRAAISREMGQKRYRKTDAPGLLVNVTIRADDQVKMTSYTAPYMSGAYYNRPGGAFYGSSLGMGVSVSQRATTVTEVSVFIDLVDVEEHKVVWQGVAVLDASDKVAKQLRDAIYTAVHEVFKQYPYTAGQ